MVCYTEQMVLDGKMAHVETSTLVDINSFNEMLRFIWLNICFWMEHTGNYDHSDYYLIGIRIFALLTDLYIWNLHNLSKFDLCVSDWAFYLRNRVFIYQILRFSSSLMSLCGGLCCRPHCWWLHHLIVGLEGWWWLLFFIIGVRGCLWLFLVTVIRGEGEWDIVEHPDLQPAL